MGLFRPVEFADPHLRTRLADQRCGQPLFDQPLAQPVARDAKSNAPPQPCILLANSCSLVPSEQPLTMVPEIAIQPAPLQ